MKVGPYFNMTEALIRRGKTKLGGEKGGGEKIAI